MKILMHKNCLDVAFDVYESHRHKPGYVTMKGRWINLGYTGKPWYLTETTKVFVREEDYKNWVNITDRFDNVRLKPGLPE